MARTGGTCGMHVHVGDRLRRGGRAGHRPAGAVAAGDPRDQRELAVLRGPRHRLRLVALAGVGPLAERRAHRSRSVRSRATGEVSARLVELGAARDPGMLYYDARLAVEHPTVEIRVPDVCTDPATSLLVAALVRGLVETAATTDDAQDFWRVEMVRAAQWRASRYGVSERLVHPLERTVEPAREVVQSLVDTVRPGARGGRRPRLRDRGGRERPAGRRRGPPARGVRAHRRRRGCRRRPGRPHRADLAVLARPRRRGTRCADSRRRLAGGDNGSPFRRQNVTSPDEAPYRLNRGHERRAPSPSPHPGRDRHRWHVHRRRRLRRGQRRAGHHEDPEHPAQPGRRVHGRHREGARPDGPPAR